MQVFVKMIDGKTEVLNVEPEDTVHSLKCKIQDKPGGFRPALQRLIFAGKQLDQDNLTLAAEKVTTNATIHLVGRLCPQLLVQWGRYGSMVIKIGNASNAQPLSSFKAMLHTASKIPEEHQRLTTFDGTPVPFTSTNYEHVEAGHILILLDAREEEKAAEVEVVGERTRADRDAVGRKRAIPVDLDDGAPAHRTRLAIEDEDLSARVAKAQSLMQPQIDAAYQALLLPHFSAYAADAIDAEELDQRKQRARREAASQHQPALSLSRAHSTYESATKAAAAAYATYEAAATAAASAKSDLESELRLHVDASYPIEATAAQGSSS